MRRGERQPKANQGEILQEKLAPYKLSPLDSDWLALGLLVWLGISKAKSCNRFKASSSPPTSSAPPAVWLSCKTSKILMRIKKIVSKQALHTLEIELENHQFYDAAIANSKQLLIQCYIQY